MTGRIVGGAVLVVVTLLCVRLASAPGRSLAGTPAGSEGPASAPQKTATGHGSDGGSAPVKWLNDNGWFDAVTSAALVLTGLIVGYYAWQTKRLREQAQYAQTFAASHAVHERFHSIESREARRFLHTLFPDVFSVIVRQVRWNWVKERRVECDEVLKAEEEPGLISKLFSEQDRYDKRCTSSTERHRAMQKAERVIGDVEMLAIPLLVDVKNPIVLAVARQYRPVIERSAEPLLPFIAVQMALRGSSDPYYKAAYLQLLETLNIEHDGLVEELLKRSRHLRKKAAQNNSSVGPGQAGADSGGSAIEPAPAAEAPEGEE